MAKFWEQLSELNRERKIWPELYKKFKGKKWIPPEKDKRGISCEVIIESPEEIDKLMRKPGKGAWHE